MTKYVFSLFTAFFLFKLISCQSVVFIDDGIGTDSDTMTNYNTDEYDLCAPKGSTPLVCENFETTDNLPAQIRDGEISLDTEVVFSGNYSLKAKTEQIESYAFVSNKFTPIESGMIFFRVYIFIPVGTITGTTKVLNLSSANNPDLEVVQGIDINISSNYRVEIYQHGNRDRYQSEPNMVPEGLWFCLRGNYIISKTAGETSIWINEDLAVSTTASTDSIINGGVSEFRTGIGWTEQGQNTATFYFDNILVDTMPVDCAIP